MTAKWVKLRTPETYFIQSKLVSVGSSIWYSTLCNYGEKGMVEFDTKENKVKNVIKYGAQEQLTCHSCCGYGNNIYIVGYNNSLKTWQFIEFNTSKHTFTAKPIPRIGSEPSIIAINQDIYIFNGFRKDGKYSICSTSMNKPLKTKLDTSYQCNLYKQAILKYKNRLIRFGGSRQTTRHTSDTFYMSSIIQATNENITWMVKPKYKLPFGNSGCGYVMYKQLIIIFGGHLGYVDGSHRYTADIYLLNLNDVRETGWIKIQNLECPHKEPYHAILMGTDVHLFGRHHSGHFVINISKILLKYDAQNVNLFSKSPSYLKNNNNIEDDEKCKKCCQLNIYLSIATGKQQDLMAMNGELELKNNE
eukprot:282692_1